MKLSSTGIGLALLLGALAALPPLAIDMALPALSPIAAAMGTTATNAGLTLSVFLAGFAVGPIVYGPAADRLGRRPVLLAGLVLFTIGGLGATGAGSITVLLGARFLQGLGAGAGMTLAFAMVRDLFEGHAAQRRLAVITIVSNIAPIVAPTLGAGLLGLTGWRGIYGVTALAGVLLTGVVWLGLGETHKPRPIAVNSLVSHLANGYRRVLTHGVAVRHIVVNGLGFGWMFAYVSGSPLVLIGVLHVSPPTYAALFACTGAGIVAGALVNGRLARHGASSRTVLLTAILLALCATTLLTGVTIAGELSLTTAMPLLVLATACFGLAAPSAAHGALGPIPELAGIAGGLLTSVQMLTGALASTLVAYLVPRLGPVAMSGTMAAYALLALIVYVLGALGRIAFLRTVAEPD
jgi:DHA1 family bicyclomycin/chloramphenicol resistance-like MFS transporter